MSFYPLILKMNGHYVIGGCWNYICFCRSCV